MKKRSYRHVDLSVHQVILTAKTPWAKKAAEELELEQMLGVRLSPADAISIQQSIEELAQRLKLEAQSSGATG